MFSPVWVSSREHLERFTKIWTEASVLRRVAGLYHIPEGFPYMHATWGILPFGKAPMVMFANGILTVESSRLRFEPRPRPRWLRLGGMLERNLDLAFRFDLDHHHIGSIQGFAVPKPFSPYFTLPWVQINTVDATRGTDELLLTLGGSGFRMGALRRRNAEFADALQRWYRQSGA